MFALQSEIVGPLAYEFSEFFSHRISSYSNAVVIKHGGRIVGHVPENLNAPQCVLRY